MAEGFNPLCGDEVQVFLHVDDDTICDVSISGQGCSISQSSASMMTTAVLGKTVDEARQVIRAFKAMMSIHGDDLDGSDHDPSNETVGSGVSLGDLEALRGVVKFPVRIKCATLAWNTLGQGLSEAAG